MSPPDPTTPGGLLSQKINSQLLTNYESSDQLVSKMKLKPGCSDFEEEDTGGRKGWECSKPED